MHRKIDAAVEQRLVDLLGEQPFAADLGERPVLHPVAGRADRDDLDHPGRRELGMRRQQAVAHQLGLAQRHRAAARSDAQRAACGCFVMRCL